MKLINGLQMRECDRRTIAGENLPVPTEGLVLMERAGYGIFTALRQHFGRLGQRPILILCGRGNNGGDGLVTGRLLARHGYASTAILLADPEELSPDAAVQYERYLAAGGEVFIATEPGDLIACLGVELRCASREAPLILDALLGTGSRGAPRGVIGAAVTEINRLRYERGAGVLAVDMPTGIDADTGEVAGEAVLADVTATMAFPKVGFFFHPAREYVGDLRVVDIGIPASVEEDVGLPLALMTPDEAYALLPARAADAHKGDVGRVMIIGGSPGLTGAPVLAAQAALRTGAGLVTVAVPCGLNAILEAKLTEAMTLPCPETPEGSLAPAAEAVILQAGTRCDVWALGPGFGRGESARKLVRSLIGSLPGPMVIDADALHALAEGNWWRPEGCPPPVLTPHPGEMARLLEAEEIEPSDPPWILAPRYAAAKGCILVLKGAPTVTAAPDGEVWINPTGNPGMATGGSGDALTGVIAALLGQGLTPFDAARLGVFLHGLAGDLATEGRDPTGLIPTDLIAALPRAQRSLADPQRSHLPIPVP